MAHLQLTALAGGADDEMEEVALLGSYDEEAGVGPEAEGDRAEAGMRRVQVRVTGMTCSACTGAGGIRGEGRWISVRSGGESRAGWCERDSRRGC